MPNGRAKKPAMKVFNMKIPIPLLEALQRQAKKEDRTAAYLVRVFVRQGLDDRNRGGAK